MELLSQKVSQSGGDIFKFAGDAMIILWTPPDLEQSDGPKLQGKQALKTLCVNDVDAGRSDPGGT